ncbi:MAG: sortase [Thermoflexaceae bacterium]|nr:sortase [Thermoflexaceae bacterium]
MRYPAYPAVDPPERRRQFSRRSLLRLALAGPPLAVGAALTLKGGLLVLDLHERERNVGKLAANTGRALEAHGLPAPPPTAAIAPTVVATGEPNIESLVEIPLPPPPNDAVADGSVGGRQIVGRVRMDSIEVDAPIVMVGLVRKGDGYVWQTADRAVGFHENSARPGGTSGNSVFSGHISSINEGDVFRRLPEIAVGDTIRLTVDSTHIYRVSDKLVVSPQDSWVMNQTAAPIATFITCVPDGVYSHRLIVVADLVKG